MRMKNSHSRIKYRVISLVDTPDQVSILVIHEEPLIKQTDFLQRFHSDKHETTRQVRHRQDPLKIHISELVVVHLPFDQSFQCRRKETPRECVERCRQFLAEVLHRSIRIMYLRHSYSDSRICIEER